MYNSEGLGAMKTITMQGKRGVIEIVIPVGEPTKEDVKRLYRGIVAIMISSQVRQQKELNNVEERPAP
jgi:hypothetical protein